MASQRRKCRLADVESRNVNLRKDAPIIIAMINTTVAGKTYESEESKSPISKRKGGRMK